jgi:hypothetical protein
MEDIWDNGRNNDKKIWIRTGKRCVSRERQNMESTMRESHILRCRGTMNWRDHVLDKRLRNPDTEITLGLQDAKQRVMGEI